MQIQTTLTQADYFAFAKQALQMRVTSGVTLKNLVFGALIGLIIFAFEKLAPSLHAPSLLLGGIAGALLIYVWVWHLTKRIAPEPGGMVLGPQRVELREQGILASGEHHENFYKWKAIRSVKETSTHFFIFFDTNLGLIIPTRAFISEHERSEFSRVVKERSSFESQLKLNS